MEIIIEKKSYKLVPERLTLEVMAKAMSKCFKEEPDLVMAGSIVFDACYDGKDIVDIKVDTVLYASICIQAAQLIEVKEGELKKN